MTIIYIYI